MSILCNGGHHRKLKSDYKGVMTGRLPLFFTMAIAFFTSTTVTAEAEKSAAHHGSDGPHHHGSDGPHASQDKMAEAHKNKSHKSSHHFT